MLRVRPIRPGDVADLTPRLRPADLQEIQAVSGEEPRQALERCVSWSEPCLTVVDPEDRPLALFGVAPDCLRDEAGIVWLVASADLERYSLSFLRQCRPWVERLHERYTVLENYVDARNERHIRWLRWCRFTLLRRVEDYGVERRPFYEFARRRHHGGSCAGKKENGVCVS